jgi:hypothetical protein
VVGYAVGLCVQGQRLRQAEDRMSAVMLADALQDMGGRRWIGSSFTW